MGSRYQRGEATAAETAGPRQNDRLPVPGNGLPAIVHAAWHRTRPPRPTYCDLDGRPLTDRILHQGSTIKPDHAQHAAGVH